MSYEERPISINPLSGDNWISLLKFWAVNIVISIITILAVMLIFYVVVGGSISIGGILAGTADGLMIGGILSVIAVLMGQFAILSIYENWDGCYRPKTT